ncbi:putative transcription factor Znf-LSD family [Helianthus debilis subsp. tardiflorus]
MQSQIVCSGCRSILLYPRGASNVCCALCNAVTSVPPPGIIIFLNFDLLFQSISRYFGQLLVEEVKVLYI